MAKHASWLQRKYLKYKKSPVLKIGLPMIGFAVLGTLFLSESVKLRHLTSNNPTMISEKDLPKDTFSMEEELKKMQQTIDLNDWANKRVSRNEDQQDT